MSSTILPESWQRKRQLLQLRKATKTFLLVQNKARHCFNQSFQTKNIESYLLRVLLLRFVDAAQFVVVHARLGHFLSQHHRPFAHTPLLFQPRLENRPQGSLREWDANIATALTQRPTPIPFDLSHSLQGISGYIIESCRTCFGT